MNPLFSEHYINGQWTSGTGEILVSTSPINDELIWKGTHATEELVSEAVAAAHDALSTWSRLPFSTRADHVLRFTQVVEKKQRELTHLIAWETGKPLWEAQTETLAVIGKAQLSIQAFHERTEDKHTSTQGMTQSLHFKPHGVVAVLGPFNFPAHLSNGHIIPSLLAGNTVVYKPSELTPAVAAFILNCWHDSGLPKGVINGIQGGVTSATYLLNQDIQGVYFTGSSRTGIALNKQFSARPNVILALEMGGNNPLVIDEVANLPAAVYQAILSSFITTGQRCTCARRIIIPNSAFGDAFLKSFLRTTSRLRIGAFTDNPEPFMGPVISHQHALIHLNAQNKLQQLGGESLLTMRLLTENSAFLSPGVMEMTAAKHVPDEEIFAPLVQIHRYTDFDHALTLANQTHFGLSAGLLSDDVTHYQHFYHTIRAGLINWNRPTTFAASNLPFGGIGLSGNHRPAAYFAADYCAYPVASITEACPTLPDVVLPGIEINDACL